MAFVGFENKNRSGNSTCLVVGVPPPTPTAIPESFHPVPSIYRAILVNIPSFTNFPLLTFLWCFGRVTLHVFNSHAYSNS